MAGKQLDPAKIAAKLIARAGAAGQDWLDGVTSQTTNPAQLAVAQNAKWKAQLTAAMQADTWAKRLGRVTLQQIVDAAKAAGAGAYTNGINSRTEKINAAFARLIPKIQAVRDKVNAMPSVTVQDRKNKMLANFDGMSAIKGT